MNNNLNTIIVAEEISPTNSRRSSINGGKDE